MTHEITSFTAWEDLAVSTALRIVQRLEPFHAHPTDDGFGGTVIGWWRNLGKKGISQQAATHMLREDLTAARLVLRARIAGVGHERLGPARAAALLVLAMLPELGPEKVLAWNDLWQALREERWDDAADALLMTEFPHTMTGNRQKMVRAVTLQRVIRSGKQFMSEEQAVAGLGIA